MKFIVQRFYIFSLILTLQLLAIADLKSQEMVYEGFIEGKKLGELMVIREVNDENIKIMVHTSLSDPSLKIARTFTSESMYVNQSLMQASCTTKLSANSLSEVQTIKMNDGYRINIDGNEKGIDRNSLIGLDIFYFEEPVNIKSVYSLAQGEMLAVVKDEKNRSYYVEDQDERQTYRYTNGVLQEIEIKHSLYTILFKLKK